MRRRAHARRWLAGLLLCLACRPTRVAVAPPPVESLSDAAAREWATTRVTVRELSERAEHAQADSILGAFRAQYPGTPSAADALFWRGMLRADPSNRSQASREASADLLAYESGGALHQHAAEAALVRRLLLQVDSLRESVVRERAAASVLIPRDSLKPRDEELVRLRAELDQTRAELERVRRRLAPPPPR
jgi:hypothetical protein